MLGALLYLRVVSFRNWLGSRLRRLRQPKYLFGAAVGAAYFWFFFFRPLGVSPPGAAAVGGLPSAVPVDWLPASAALGSLALLSFVALMWIVPAQRAALGFTEAEIAFLFPAPITRRGLIHFRLLSAQARSLAGAAVMVLFSNRWTFLGGNALTHAVGWWFIFSGLNLHFSGASFTLTRLADLGLRAWRRRVLAAAVLAAVVGTTFARLPAEARLPVLRHEFDFAPVAAWAMALADTAPLGWLLVPFRLVLGPFLAADTRAFFLALGPAVAVLGLHYLWVVRSAAAFEDGAVEHAQQRAARLAAWRAGGARPGAGPAKARPGPFALRDGGRPELAFLWKNLLSTWAYFTPRLWLAAAAAIAGGCLWLRAQPEWRGLLPALAMPAVLAAGYLLVVGPQFARQDIRSDLGRADILKTYPLAGWQIVLGQLLAPTAILTGLLWLALLFVALALPGPRELAWLTPAVRITGALALALVAPALVALQLLVPNAAALFLPAWFQATRTRGGGPEVIGQRMIFFFAQLVAMLLALAPAAGLALTLVFILQAFVGAAAAIAVALVAVLAVLLAELACGVWLLGRRFEALDLSAELRA